MKASGPSITYWMLEDAPHWLRWLWMRGLCLRHGHKVIRDHDQRPEHDYCVVCRRVMPGQAKVGMGGVDDG